MDPAAVVEFAPIPVWIQREEEILRVNEEAVRYFEATSASEVVGRSAFSYVPEEHQARVRRRNRRVLDDGISLDAVEGRTIAQDGAIKHGRYAVAPVTYDDEPAILVMAQDVTERVERERELRRFKQAVESAGHAVYWTDPEGTIKYVNPAFEDVTGFSQEEVLGENPGILNSGEMPDGYFENLWDTVKGGEVWEEEVVNKRKSGEKYYAVQTIAPITGPEGEIEGFVAIQQDITERKREQRKLEQYRQAVESSNDLVVAVDTDLELLFANEKYGQYHNINTDAIEGKHLQEILSQEDYATIEDTVKAGLEGKETTFEFTREIPGGEERVLEADLFQIRDEDGEIQGLGASIRDITSQKEYERHLETLIRNLPGVVYRCRNERGWPMEMVRGRSGALTGYTAEEIETGDVSWGEDIIVPEDREDVWSQIQESVGADEPFELNYQITTKSGDEKWVWEKGRLVTPFDSDETKLEGFVTDITDQKRLEEELREASERYKALFTSIRDAILVADTNGRIINCNPAFTDLFGYELEQIEGKHTKYVYASEEENEALGEAIEGHIGDPKFSRAATFKKKSGQTFPGETSVFYLRDADDEIIGFIGVIKDISEKRDRLTQLQILDRILQHNFHNDMNVIRGNAERIEEEGTSPLTGYAEKIRQTGSELLETVEKERKITNFLSDPPPADVVDLTEASSEVKERVSSRFPAAEISTDFTEEGFVEVTTAIEWAIEELLTNSIVHSDMDVPRVELDVKSSAAGVTVQVIDENPPIPEMERKVITGEEKLSPLYHGSGMGLWFVSLIVDYSDGILEFVENEGRGNVVQIRLPGV